MMMDNLYTGIVTWGRYITAALGGGISALLGGWDLALQVLVIFVVADYITGVLAAWHKKELNSEVGLWGIAKKALIFVPVALGYWLDQVLGQDILREIIIWFYIANEGLSVTENLGRVGILVPERLLDALEQLREKDKKDK